MELIATSKVSAMKAVCVLAIFNAFLGYTAGLVCYTCNKYNLDPGSNDDCLAHPENTRPYNYSDKVGKTTFCTAEIVTSNGVVSVYRRMEQIPNEDVKNDTGCVDGPYQGTRDPGNNYVQYCYCRSDSCNDMKYKPPKKMVSPLKCYICKWDDDGCNEPDEKYLTAMPAIPDSVPSKNFPKNQEPISNQTLTALTPSRPIGDFLYTPYCYTTWSDSKEKRLVSRDMWWRWEEPDLDGFCETPPGYTFYWCFCTGKDGCNGKGGAPTQTIGIFTILLGISVSFISKFQLG